MVAIFLHIVLLFFIGLMLLAAAWDVTRFTIPNWLCVAVAILFPVAALLSGMGWELAGLHLLSGVLAFVLGFALFATGTLGGGDAKLFAAASLWFAWPVTLAYLFALVLAGGVFALVLLIVRYSAPHAAALIRRHHPDFRTPSFLRGETLFSKGAPIPYGVALAAGVLWVLPNTHFYVVA